MQIAASTAATLARLERREAAELFEPRIDLRPLERAETFHTELLTAETSHDRTVDYRAAQIAPAEVIAFEIEALLRQITDEAARETVSRAGWIENRLQQ